MAVRGVFHKKVNLALLLIDAYTDEIISNTVFVSAGLYRPIRKKDGYFVFTNMDVDGLVQFDIISDIYEQQRLFVDLSAINPKRPIVKYKLTPKPRYLPGDITALSGKSTPGSKISIIYENSVNTFKFLYDVEKGQEYVHIYNPGGKDLEGDEMAIVDKKGIVLEIISLDLKKDNGIYETKAFKKAYKKSESSLLRTAFVITGEDGVYFYPIRHFEPKNKKVSIITDGNLKSLMTAEIEKGVINHIK